MQQASLPPSLQYYPFLLPDIKTISPLIRRNKRIRLLFVTTPLPPHLTIPVPPLADACYLTRSSRHQNVFPNIPRSSWSRCCCSRQRRNLTSEGLPGQQSPVISKSNAVHNRQSNIHSANSETRVTATQTQGNSKILIYSFTSSLHLHLSLSLSLTSCF